MSRVILEGHSFFKDNVAKTFYGGAIMATTEAEVCVRGSTTFMNNSCGSEGGAIQAEFHSKIELAGHARFEANRADEFGGAINLYDGSNITNTGEASFVNNSAETGGAMYISARCEATLVNRTVFLNNSASIDGGALYAYRSSVLLAGRPVFDGNTALTGSGGAMYCVNAGNLRLEGVQFINNLAVWGGAVATFSSGASSSLSLEHYMVSINGAESDEEDTEDDSVALSSSQASDSSIPIDGPVVFAGCIFRENRAIEEGGGIYSLAGYDYIVDSNFTDNVADSSGGGLAHSGVLEEVVRCAFVGNRAGNEGPAVDSLGRIISMSDVLFEDNHKICNEGYYSGDEPAEGDQCRFTLVCARCDRECDSGLAAGAIVKKPNSIPKCLETPEGSTTKEPGATLETLEILKGYYRASNLTKDIRECFQEDACQGGISPESYCSTGYMGPYCAVCEPGYEAGYSYECNACEGESKARAVGFTCAVLAVVVLLVGVVISRLIAVVEPPASKAMGPWGRKAARLRVRLRKTFPLTAVKIVVVVWQIVAQYTQVSGVEYPRIYESFLEVIDVVNLDLGYILTFSCIFHTDFYDRLLIATIGPFVLMALLGVTYLIARRRNGHSEEAMKRVKHKHISIALFVTFVVYSTVSYIIFGTYVCDEIGGVRYLRGDYSLECGTPRHEAYKVYAAMMIVVYPLGIPTMFTWWLYRHREALKSDDRMSKPELRPASDLWEPYKNDKFYYEVVECVRRIALTGLAVFIYPESSAQIAIVLFLAAVFMVISEVLAPFVRPLEMWLYRAGHYVVFASMYLALLLRVDVSDESSKSQEVFAGVVVAAHVTMLLVVITQGILLFVGWAEIIEAPSGLDMADGEEAPPLSPVGVDSFRRSSSDDLEDLREDITRNAKDTFFLGEDPSTSSKGDESLSVRPRSPSSSSSVSSSSCAVSPQVMSPSKVSLGEHARRIPFFSQGSRATASTIASTVGFESATGFRVVSTPPSTTRGTGTPGEYRRPSPAASQHSAGSLERSRRGFINPRGILSDSCKVGPKISSRSRETAVVNGWDGSPRTDGGFVPSPRLPERRALRTTRQWRSVEMMAIMSDIRSSRGRMGAEKSAKDTSVEVSTDFVPRGPPPRSTTTASMSQSRLPPGAVAGTLDRKSLKSVRQIWHDDRASRTSSGEVGDLAGHLGVALRHPASADPSRPAVEFFPNLAKFATTGSTRPVRELVRDKTRSAVDVGSSECVYPR